MRCSLRGVALVGALAVVVSGAAPVSAQAGDAPGAPGAAAVFTPADKQGFGTARGPDSTVWFTLGGGRMTEAFYPDLSTPAVRDLQLVVTDGVSFVERAQDVAVRTEPVEGLTFRQVATGTGWSATITYVTDPGRPSVLLDVDLRADRPLRTFVLYDPALSREGGDDRARTVGRTLVASDGHAASALVAGRGFAETSNGYLGASDGWTDLSVDRRLDGHFRTAGPGNVVQTGRLRLDGVRERHDTVVLGFGANAGQAQASAHRSLAAGFERAAAGYARGWRTYLAGLRQPPASLTTARERALYASSLMVMAATEDKRNPGAFIAAPALPWAFGFDRVIVPEFGPYALVWPRDLYQVASALLAAGDRPAAERALDYMLRRQQQADGHLAQNTRVDGSPYWTSVQLDETAAPMLLAWLLGRTDAATLDGLRRAAEFMVSFTKDGNTAPWTEQERWENQSGYSPATIASEIAGLVCLADLLARSGDAERADRYLAIADAWQSAVEGWTATSTGPYSARPYYLRLTKDGRPDQGTRYNLGDNNVGEVDQRTVVDPSFLELVRLGVRAPDDPVIANTVAVVDEQLADRAETGFFWHRFTSDGYGEQADGGPWNVNFPQPTRTFGRLWPIFAGERGEYELVAGDLGAARERLSSIAATANGGLMLPEQVWDNRPPAPAVRPGTGTTSATPLAWTHAQFVRLALSIDAGEPVERPDVVACRYSGPC
ncbi:MAG TPA: glycoside hydrolase family 15 protein [Actinophytocola sp.]|uniref:glycoside hydrolase family 15 protein n=1 Tax=Actinophytocola sp. TaxID=1872138 RepID=UPI002DDCD35E|nr:glycoside hydrolase family 15 protein [Actinophytocola sp.]HEV2784186.1 glycoside hydrolase family 15 protein [Actinophytocola sp.]